MSSANDRSGLWTLCLGVLLLAGTAQRAEGQNGDLMDFDFVGGVHGPECPLLISESFHQVKLQAEPVPARSGQAAAKAPVECEVYGWRDERPIRKTKFDLWIRVFDDQGRALGQFKRKVKTDTEGVAKGGFSIEPRAGVKKILLVVQSTLKNPQKVDQHGYMCTIGELAP